MRQWGLGVPQGSPYLLIPWRGQLDLLLHVAATPDSCLLAYLHACLVRYHMRRDEHDGDLLITLKRSRELARQWLEELTQSLREAGWAIDKITIEGRKHRAVW